MNRESGAGGAVGELERTLRERIDGGHKCLVSYFTGGLPMEQGDWCTTLSTIAAAGADAMEVGIPFSDPVMDGPVIQRASEAALAAGATPPGVLDSLSRLDVEVPLAVMTYANLAYRFGWQRFASTLVQSGVRAAILADIPLEESGPWRHAAAAAGIEAVLLAAPTASDARLLRIVEHSAGFVYAVGLLGTTGERGALADTSKVIAARLKAITEKPVLVGVGIGTPEQAAQVCEVADGVVVGSALVRRALETGSADAVGELVGEFATALNHG